MPRLTKDATIVILIAVAVAVLFADIFVFGSGFYVRDVLHDYLPSRAVLRAVVAQGEFPLWNRFFACGQPLAANPGFQAFYPGTWLVFLPSFLFGFNLEIVLHIALAAIGMFLFLRSLPLRIESSLFGALAFALGGCVLSLTNLLPFLTSVAWWPLILLFARRVLRGGTRRDLAGLALTLAMLFLAAEQSVIVQTAILLAALLIIERQSKSLIKFVLACAIAFGIGAVQLVPALDLMRDSSRALPLIYDDAVAWSMPLIRPVELFYPHAFGRVTDDGLQFRGAWRYNPARLPLIFRIYCGLLAPLLVIAGIARRVRGWIAAASLALLSYLLAIGGNGPLVPALYSAGVFRGIRYPEKFVLFGLFVLIVFAAIVLDRLDRRLIVVALVITLLDLGLHVQELAPRMPRAFFAPPKIVAAMSNARFPRPGRIFNAAAWPVWGANAVKLATGERTYWSERAILPPFTSALYGLQSAMELDINLTNLRPTAAFVQSMWEARVRGVPPGAALLPMTGIESIITPGHEGAELVDVIHVPTEGRYRFAGTLVRIASRDDFVRLLTTQRWSPHTAFVSFPPFMPEAGQVTGIEETANQAAIKVRTRGRGFLMIGVTPHRYWRAAIDGQPAKLEVTNIGFQGIIVPGGEHTITMTYRNPVIIVSAIVSLLSLIVAVVSLVARSPRST
jgi:hypothetical protein